MKKYFLVDEDRKLILTPQEKFIRSVKRCLNTDMLAGVFHIMKKVFKKNNLVTIHYPMEKIKLDNRYRAVHRLQRFIESETERCIGCGLCEKICISNCIRMETKLGEDGRKVVSNYSINLSRCIYCGFCAEVCPELAIVHGDDYENAAEQRGYFAHKDDILTPIDELKNQVEFQGMGSLRVDANDFVKATPNYYEVNIHKINSKEESEEKEDV